MERRPVVAGQFYPGGKNALEQEVARLLEHDVKPKKAIAAIAPHAGYVYPGGVAGKVFASVAVPPRCIVLSPNHTGAGARAALWTKGAWTIPTGIVPIDEELCQALLTASPDIAPDTAAHLGEHSLEVLPPFLLARQPRLTIAPLTLGHLGGPVCRRIGEAIAGVVAEDRDGILLVVSTDMNHYEDEARTLAKDRLAIERVLAFDPDGLLATCGEQRISMCGVVPTAVALWASRKLGATKATLVEHTTSGKVSGDYDAVVGYAGFVIE